MVTDTTATTREETPHATETTISDALRRRAQSLIDDIWIDPQWRSIIRYALETSDPFLADLVSRADAGEMIVDTIDFSKMPDTNNNDDSIEEKICALSEIICEAGDRATAALFVLMGNARTMCRSQSTRKHGQALRLRSLR